MFACSTLRLDPHAPVYISRVHAVVDEDGNLLSIKFYYPALAYDRLAPDYPLVLLTRPRLRYEKHPCLPSVRDRGW